MIIFPRISPDTGEPAERKSELNDQFHGFRHDSFPVELLTEPVAHLRLVPIDVDERDRADHTVSGIDPKIYAAHGVNPFFFFLEPLPPLCRIHLRIRIRDVRNTIGDPRRIDVPYDRGFIADNERPKCELSARSHDA